MKKIILTAILGLFLGLANISLAQVSPNYKQQFPIKKGKVESTIIYSVAPDSYHAVNNYKQSTTLNKDVVTVSNKPATLPFCCLNVGANADYKHPFPSNGKATCDMGYICKEKAKGACCN